MTAMPSAAVRSLPAKSSVRAVTTTLGRVPRRRKAVVAAGHPAGDLQVDDAFSRTRLRRRHSRITIPSAAGDIGMAMRSSPSERCSRSR